MRREQSGFTLIELMIVVAIIAILASIALPTYRQYVARVDVVNAVGGCAGEKIKVGDNWSQGRFATQAELCESVSSDVTCSALGQLTCDSTSTRSQIRLDPTFPVPGSPNRITWACQVLTSIGGLYNGQSCDI